MELITQSRLRALRKCPRYHEYQYELRLRPVRSARYLRLGHAVHEAIARHHRGAGEDEALRLVIQDYRAHIEKVAEPDQMNDLLFEAAVVAELVRGYIWRWAASGLRVCMVEQTIEMPLRNPRTGAHSPHWTVAGKLDAISTSTGGQACVHELKTTSADLSASSDYWRLLRMDGQISAYVLLARSMAYDVQSVLYDVIRKPSIRPRAVQRVEVKTYLLASTYHGELLGAEQWSAVFETPEMYAARLRADIRQRPDWYYARVEIPRLEDDLDEFAEDAWNYMQSLKDHRRRRYWPRNPDACLVMGRCPYFDLCSQGRHWTDSERVPDGFVQLTTSHPELETADDVEETTAAATA